MEDAGNPDPVLTTVDVSARVTINTNRARVFEILWTRFGDWVLGYPDHNPLSLIVEGRPGGRVYRDDPESGAWWGTVQMFRPPKRLDIHGPLFAEAPSLSHVSFRLEESGPGTLVTLRHRAIGAFPAPESLIETAWNSHLACLTGLFE